MGTASTTSRSLKLLLRSLCHNSQWKYAIFWKLKHRSRMLLTWEDGYCDYPQPRDSMHRNISPDREIKTYDGGSAEYSIGLAVANMSCLMYALGEGAVGKVALTGKYSWVFAHKFNSKHVPEYPDEWHLQFAIGIKTILLVPVLPHGVVQLGSLEVVTEDLKLVAYIKDLFNTVQNVPDGSSLFTLSDDFRDPSCSTLLGDFAVPSDIVDELLNPVKQETKTKKGVSVHDVGQITANKPSAYSAPLSSSHFMVQDDLQISQKTTQCILGGQTMDGSVSEKVYDMLLANMSGPSYSQNQFMGTDHLEDMPDFSCLKEGLHFSSQYAAVDHQSSMFNHCDKTDKKNDHNINTNSSAGYSFYPGCMVDDQFESVSMEIGHEIAHSFLSYPAYSELHELLEPAFHEGCHLDQTLSGYDRCSGLSLIYQTDSTGDNDLSIGEFVGSVVKEGTEEHLLDAVVANVYGTSEDCKFGTFTNIRSPSCSSGQLTTSCQTQSRSSVGVLGDDMSPWDYMRSASAARNGDAFTTSPSGSSSRATSVLIDEVPQKIELEDGCSKRGAKPHQVSKRKVIAAGDIQKPRPRDRQLIQDRVKELREIVPNGSKCSIDALLERTVKHMVFLQNVTNQGEKLKQCLHSKVMGNENWNGSASQSHQTNATWAFELGSQPGVYPIVVENLDQPGHMLVEMLCEEHGLFLEIAEVIHNLEFTILKGVMEKRSDKIWAHFIVEVSRGFERMDIIWPLMQLLQRSRNPISSKF